MQQTHQNQAAVVHASLAAGDTGNEHLDKRTKWIVKRQKPVDVSKFCHIYVGLYVVQFSFSARAEVLNTFLRLRVLSALASSWDVTDFQSGHATFLFLTVVLF